MEHEKDDKVSSWPSWCHCRVVRNFARRPRMDHRQLPIFILPDLSFDDGFHDERHAILRQGAKDGKGPSRQGVLHTIGRTFAAQRLVSSQPFHPTHDKLMMGYHLE